MIANLRDCARIYDCGNGTEKSCKRAFCPFYKEWMTEPKHSKPIKTKVVMHGYWDFDDPSGIPMYREEKVKC